MKHLSLNKPKRHKIERPNYFDQPPTPNRKTKSINDDHNKPSKKNISQKKKWETSKHEEDGGRARELKKKCVKWQRRPNEIRGSKP